MNQNSGTSEVHEKAEALELRPFYIQKNLTAHGADQVFLSSFFYAFSISISKSPV